MTKRVNAISRAVAVGIVVVLIIVVVAGAYLALAPSTKSSITSSNPSLTSSSSSTSSVSSTTITNGTLNIDDAVWTGFQLGIFNFPNWWQDSVYQYLVTLNASAENNGQIVYVPDLASTITISPDGKTYTFSLRPGVTYSDATAFNAYDVWAIFYLQYYMFANASNFLYGIPVFDFSKVNFGPSTFSLMNQTNSFTSPSQSLLSLMTNSNWPVYVKNQSTVVFQLTSPYSYFRSLLTAPIMLIFEPAYVMQHGGPGAPGAPNSFFLLNPPPGTGPYKIASVAENSRYVYVKNPSYWGDSLTPTQMAANGALDPGHFATIIVNTVSDPSISYVDLTQGRVQVAEILGSNFEIFLRSNNSAYNWVTFGKYSAAGQVFLSMNTQRYPTNITDVRLAIVHGINITQIIDQAVFGLGGTYFGPETPIFGQLYNPLDYAPYSYNLTEAANYLTQAGFPNGNGLPAIKLDIQAGFAWMETAAELIQSDLANIGITVNINVLSFPTFLSTYYSPYSQMLANPAIQMALDSGYAYFPDYMAPTDYLGQFTTNLSSYGNYALYNSNATYSAFKTLFSTNNLTLQRQAMITAEQQIYKDAPYDWLFLPTLYLVGGSYVYSTQVVHHLYLEPNLFGEQDLPLLNTIG